MFCEKCGQKREEKDKFCAHCGASFNGDTATVIEQPVPVQQPAPKVERYESIGGWLYLVGFGLFITPFILAYGVFDTFSLVSDGSLSELDSLVPGLANAIWFELIMDTALFFAVIYLIFLFRGMKREFPKYFVWYMAVSIAYLVIDYALVASLTTSSGEMRNILDATLDEQIGSMTGAIFGSVIWIAYMKKSKRVAGTFVK
ncbi:hypothetical protein CL655_02960 [bacterium]|nr:hypothetical protein [bacterium]MAZ30220.1 hypothetical protein [bacterium]|tara:strand:+ start:1367 stop:1969 length:603 start_codon:yes stop_codon:yes gene_type:complete